MLAAMLGAVYAGCFYVPVNPDNPPGTAYEDLSHAGTGDPGDGPEDGGTVRREDTSGSLRKTW